MIAKDRLETADLNKIRITIICDLSVMVCIGVYKCGCVVVVEESKTA